MIPTYLTDAMSGAMLLGYWAIGLFFFRFQRHTHDRFFGFFGAAFSLLAIERVLLIAFGGADEYIAYIYLIRLVAFLSIIYAIVDKNRKSGAAQRK